MLYFKAVTKGILSEEIVSFITQLTAVSIVVYVGNLTVEMIVFKT